MALLNVDLQAITSFSDSRLVSMRRRARELAEERHPSFHAVVTSIDTELQRRYLARVDSKALYEIAKAQPVGSEVVCPHCLMEFTKRKSSQAFVQTHAVTVLTIAKMDFGTLLVTW